MTFSTLVKRLDLLEKAHTGTPERDITPLTVSFHAPTYCEIHKKTSLLTLIPVLFFKTPVSIS